MGILEVLVVMARRARVTVPVPCDGLRTTGACRWGLLTSRTAEVTIWMGMRVRSSKTDLGAEEWDSHHRTKDQSHGHFDLFRYSTYLHDDIESQ
jgi:hypothetical protein